MQMLAKRYVRNYCVLTKGCVSGGQYYAIGHTLRFSTQRVENLCHYFLGLIIVFFCRLKIRKHVIGMRKKLQNRIEATELYSETFRRRIIIV